MVIGSIIFFKDKKSLANQSLFLYAIMMTLFILSIYSGYFFVNPFFPQLSTFFIRIAFGFGIFVSFFLCIFAYYYPRKIYIYPKKIEYIFFLATITTASLSSFTSLVYKKELIVNGFEIEDVHGPLHNMYLLHFLFNSFLAIWIAIEKTKRLKGIEKNKTILSLIGLSTAVLPMIMFYTILPKFGIYLLQTEAVLFNLFFIGIVFYSINKYRFFYLSAFAINFLRRVVFFTIVILVGFILAYFIKSFSYKNIVITNILIFVSAIMIYQKLEKIFPKFLPHNLKEFRTLVAELIYKSLFFDDYFILQNALEKIFILKLSISKAQLLLIRNEKTKIDIPVYLKDQLVVFLEKYETDILLKEEIPFLDFSDKNKQILLNAMKELEASVCLPLFSEKKIIGLFILGEKEDNESYMQEEIEGLLKLRSSLEICFMNILLKRNLKKENNLMKATIEEKTHQIKKQYCKIKELLDQQSSFIAVTAHEFRTPLSVALFQLEDILEMEEKSLRLEDVKIIEKSLNNLKKLTQNLFDVQQYDLNKAALNLEKVDLVEFIENILIDCKNLTREKKITSSFKNNLKKQCFCRIDKQQMLQVLHNVLTNAIKFTPKAGEILTEITQNSEGILLKVIDSGIGVSDENKKRIFEKFQTEKLGSSTGIGLGLYICKKIIDLHKGKIWVEDSPNGGATFCVFLKILN